MPSSGNQRLPLIWSMMPLPPEFRQLMSWWIHGSQMSLLSKKVQEEGIGVIGMIKDNRQRYYKGRLYNLKQLATLMDFDRPCSVFGSVCVKTMKYGIPVKLVYVRNRNKKSNISSFSQRTAPCPTVRSSAHIGAAGRSRYFSVPPSPCWISEMNFRVSVMT